MTGQTTLTSSQDGFVLPALSASAESVVGGVVVIQEIFGLTDHVADMCARFARQGYAVLAPSLFERVAPGFQAELDATGIEQGRAAAAASPWPQILSDIQAAVDALPQPCYVTGFCYGGAVAWLAAARCTGVRAASCFYGRLIAELTDASPRAPVMLHYGARDASIPPDNIERVCGVAPDAPLYLYDAGHGFCRDGSPDFNAAARDLAMSRTMDWFARWR